MHCVFVIYDIIVFGKKQKGFVLLRYFEKFLKVKLNH